MNKQQFRFKNKWTGLFGGVHLDECTDGHTNTFQVIDIAGQLMCPLNDNLGVNHEGTLPGKA